MVGTSQRFVRNASRRQAERRCGLRLIAARRLGWELWKVDDMVAGSARRVPTRLPGSPSGIVNDPWGGPAHRRSQRKCSRLRSESGMAAQFATIQHAVGRWKR